MKKLSNNCRFALIKILAAVTIFQASVGIFNHKEESNLCESYCSDINIDWFVNKILSSMNYVPVSIKLDRDNSIIVDFEDYRSFIKVYNNQVFIETKYSDGFFEERVFDLNNLEDVSFDDYEKNFTLETQYSYYDFSDENISNLEKEYVVMQAFKISQSQLDYVLAGAMAEGIEDNYRDVSAAMRTGVNRLFSYVWLNHAINNLELDCDYREVTIYDIFRDPNQFAVYYSKSQSPRYEKFLGVKSGEGYQAALDTLYYTIFENNIPEDLVDKIVIHDYLEFQDNNDPVPAGYSFEQFVEGGNKHYRHQLDSDRVLLEDSILKDFLDVFSILSREEILEGIRSLEDENILSLNNN